MTSIIYLGMDVHTTNFTMCCYSIEDDQTFGVIKLAPDYREILKYIDRITKQHGGNCKIVCGYEAGCLGFSLYHQLHDHGVNCVIMAPSTIQVAPGKRIKTDRRDAENISKSLAYHTYSPVHVPTEEDNAVKEYIRMRDDANAELKRIKQQTIAFCTRNGKQYDGKTYWTKRHLDWLRSLDFGNAILNETLQEYLTFYYQVKEKVDMFDLRIQELAQRDSYRENVQKLCCFNGIQVHTALSLLSEVSDFNRFKTARNFASFLGLVPGEHSSSDDQNRLGITKSGNSHLRRLLVETAQSYTRGQIGNKSVALKQRQQLCDSDVVAYADKANERLRRKYYHLTLQKSKKANVAKTAVARELACFIWGMMTGNTAECP